MVDTRYAPEDEERKARTVVTAPPLVKDRQPSAPLLVRLTMPPRSIKYSNRAVALVMRIAIPKRGWGRKRNGDFSPLKALQQVVRRPIVATMLGMAGVAVAMGTLTALWFPLTLASLYGLTKTPKLYRAYKEFKRNVFGNTLDMAKRKEQERKLEGKTGPSAGTPGVDLPGQRQTVAPTPAKDMPGQRLYTLPDPQANFYLEKLNAAYAAANLSEVHDIVARVAHQPRGADHGDQARGLRKLIENLGAQPTMASVQRSIDRALRPLDGQYAAQQAATMSKQSPSQRRHKLPQLGAHKGMTPAQQAGLMQSFYRGGGGAIQGGGGSFGL